MEISGWTHNRENMGSNPVDLHVFQTLDKFVQSVLCEKVTWLPTCVH